MDGSVLAPIATVIVALIAAAGAGFPSSCWPRSARTVSRCAVNLGGLGVAHLAWRHNCRLRNALTQRERFGW
jgi:hypothetical protein